jgi:hypothetical protein
MWKRIFAFNVLSLFAIALWAQTDAGSLSGLITDPSSAAIQGATVRLRSGATGTSREAVTDESGYYSFQGLPVGQYRISADHPGFSVATASISIDPSEKGHFDIQLIVGAPRTTVEVQGSAGLLSHDDASIGSVIENPIIENTALDA